MQKKLFIIGKDAKFCMTRSLRRISLENHKVDQNVGHPSLRQKSQLK